MAAHLATLSSMIEPSGGLPREMIEAMQWEKITADPSGHIKLLLELQNKNRREAHRLKLMIGQARLLEKSRGLLEGWRVHGIPDPPEKVTASDSLPGQRPPVHDSDGQPEQRTRPRSQRIIQLFSQDPDRAWKTREVAESLDERNIKSVRVTLDEMARKGNVIKNSDSSYRLGDYE